MKPSRRSALGNSNKHETKQGITIDSDKIADLRNALSPISNYFEMKKKIMKLIKKGILNEKFIVLSKALIDERDRIIKNKLIKKIVKIIDSL